MASNVNEIKAMREQREYIPRPIDTSEVVVPKELKELSEELARNVHETWAKERMSQGWTWGEVRDDKKRTHPCLVPYDELSEEEKEFDRITSQETLRFILKYGFRIEKNKKNLSSTS